MQLNKFLRFLSSELPKFERVECEANAEPYDFTSRDIFFDINEKDYYEEDEEYIISDFNSNHKFYKFTDSDCIIYVITDLDDNITEINTGVPLDRFGTSVISTLPNKYFCSENKEDFLSIMDDSINDFILELIKEIHTNPVRFQSRLYLTKGKVLKNISDRLLNKLGPDYQMVADEEELSKINIHICNTEKGKDLLGISLEVNSVTGKIEIESNYEINKDAFDIYLFSELKKFVEKGNYLKEDDNSLNCLDFLF